MFSHFGEHTLANSSWSALTSWIPEHMYLNGYGSFVGQSPIFLQLFVKGTIFNAKKVGRGYMMALSMVNSTHLLETFKPMVIL